MGILKESSSGYNRHSRQKSTFTF